MKGTRFARFRRTFVDNYMTADARSLGFGRIVLALILLFDLWHRARVITLFYSNDGLIPNHMMLWRPPTQWMFSFFFILSHPDEVAVGFAFCALVYLCLLVGWRTRVMQVLAVICVLSLRTAATGCWASSRSGPPFCRSGGGSPSTPCAPACARAARRRRPSSPTGRRWT